MPNSCCKCSRDVGLFLLRLGTGIIFIVFGYMKLRAGREMWGMIGSATGNFGVHFAPTAWGLFASLVEFLGGILLILGLFTRATAAVMMIQMIVAVVTHLHMPAPMNEFGAGYSHALGEGVVFLALIFTGAGMLSLDHLLFRRAEAPGFPLTDPSDPQR